MSTSTKRKPLSRHVRFRTSDVHTFEINLCESCFQESLKGPYLVISFGPYVFREEAWA